MWGTRRLIGIGGYKEAYKYWGENKGYLVKMRIFLLERYKLGRG
jgi:hypothetical protein